MERRRTIVHVDLDAFYASVEIRDDPSLRGRPVVVGGSVRRGVVTAASYEARKFGVHSAMPMARALALCPQLVVMPIRMARYAAVSDQFFAVLGRYSPLVEGLSLDEAFLDLTGTQALLGEPMAAVRRLREEVRQVTGLACSAGISGVKFVAKIATDLAKPDGQLEVAPDRVIEFLDPLPIGRLWGVGPRREAQLKALRIKTISDLREFPQARLLRELGSEALHLQALSRGEDERAVVPDRAAKSVGAEETFDEDLEDPDEIDTYLLAQSERIAARLRQSGIAAGGVTLKYKLNDFRLVTRQTTIDPTNDGPTLYAAVKKLLRAHPPPRPIRLVGLSAHALGPPPARGLFAKADDRRDRLNSALDSVHEKFGTNALKRARLLELDPDDES